MHTNNQSNGVAVNEGLATVEEASRFLSISRSKLYDEMDAGRLSYCKLGRSRRIPWQAIYDRVSSSLVNAKA